MKEFIKSKVNKIKEFINSIKNTYSPYIYFLLCMSSIVNDIIFYIKTDFYNDHIKNAYLAFIIIHPVILFFSLGYVYFLIIKKTNANFDTKKKYLNLVVIFLISYLGYYKIIFASLLRYINFVAKILYLNEEYKTQIIKNNFEDPDNIALGKKNSFFKNYIDFFSIYLEGFPHIILIIVNNSKINEWNTFDIIIIVIKFLKIIFHIFKFLFNFSNAKKFQRNKNKVEDLENQNKEIAKNFQYSTLEFNIEDEYQLVKWTKDNILKLQVALYNFHNYRATFFIENMNTKTKVSPDYFIKDQINETEDNIWHKLKIKIKNQIEQMKECFDFQFRNKSIEKEILYVKYKEFISKDLFIFKELLNNHENFSRMEFEHLLQKAHDNIMNNYDYYKEKIFFENLKKQLKKERIDQIKCFDSRYIGKILIL